MEKGRFPQKRDASPFPQNFGLFILLQKRVEKPYFRHSCHSKMTAHTYPDARPCIASEAETLHPLFTCSTRRYFSHTLQFCGSTQYQVSRSTNHGQLPFPLDLPTWLAHAASSTARATHCHQSLHGMCSTQPAPWGTQELLHWI